MTFSSRLGNQFTDLENPTTFQGCGVFLCLPILIQSWFYATFDSMKAVINIDAQILASAQNLFGDMTASEIAHQAIKELVARESAKRLANLFGSEAEAVAPSRH